MAVGWRPVTGDPGAGGATVRILAPLAIRDFALLYAGMAVSLLGDGMYTVAIAWQVYALSNAPTALSVVGVAWSVPQVVLLLFLVTCLAFWGPFEVLVPYLVKNELGGDAADLGLVFAAGGAGSVLVSLAMGQWGIPRLHITFMYVTWTLAVVAFCAFAGVETAWQGMAASFVIFALITAGLIAWMTLVQRLVPPELLGRVKSLEWLLTIGLVPVSFALTGPVAGAIGARPTTFWAGLAAGVLTLGAYFLPGMRDTERDGGSRVVLGRPDV